MLVNTCKTARLDFIILDGEDTLKNIADDIRGDLAKVGINAELRILPWDEFNAAKAAGDFNLAFSETWGPPYDPHTYAASWSTPDEALYAALKGLPEPNTYDVVMDKIRNVLKATAEKDLQAGWTEIFTTLHNAAAVLPISGKQIPAIINKRLSGYRPGHQQFDYPIHTLRVLSGSRTITVSPGSQAGLFSSVGRLDPHTYRPNEFWASNLIYEGLVEYGPGGTIVPSLATSWTVEDCLEGATDCPADGQKSWKTACEFRWICRAFTWRGTIYMSGFAVKENHQILKSFRGVWHTPSSVSKWLPSIRNGFMWRSSVPYVCRYTFSLRQGVKFHDGADWDCSAAKLNFDHLLSTGSYHGWYGLMEQINTWSCKDGETHVFEVTTKDRYYPFLQELTFIRPVRMLSPLKFTGGASSDPETQNSCAPGTEWGIPDTVTCAGVTGIAGTGRWEFVSKEDNADVEAIQGSPVNDEVTFKLSTTHWDAAPADWDVEFLKVVRYADAAAVKAALIDGSLDAVIGGGVLEAADIMEFRDQRMDLFDVSLTEPLQNNLVIFNTAKVPTDDIQMRKVVIHAVNKAAIVEKEFGGLATPVNQLFPTTAPYANVHLTPISDYDLAKAELLNCPETLSPVDLKLGVCQRASQYCRLGSCHGRVTTSISAKPIFLHEAGYSGGDCSGKPAVSGTFRQPPQPTAYRSD